jgi:Transposase, Mutator family
VYRALLPQRLLRRSAPEDARGRGDAEGDPKAAELVESGIEETLAYYTFPEEHWRRIRTNNPLERILREIRRRTRLVGAFPDGQSALNLAAARLRHIAGSEWSTKRYLSMDLLSSFRPTEYGGLPNNHADVKLLLPTPTQTRSSFSYIWKASVGKHSVSTAGLGGVTAVVRLPG